MNNELVIKSQIPKDVEKRRRLAVFIKRKRIEHHLTLEELSKGVCTVSYLSRIENNVVDVGDEYFTLLFDKLDLDYNLLKESKDNLVLDDILKAYLLNNYEESLEIIDKASKTDYYVDVEYSLMKLYVAIINRNFPVAKELLFDLNRNSDTLVDHELYFFMFLNALYSYYVELGDWAEEQILELLQRSEANGIIKEATLDLALDIFFFNGRISMFYKYYEVLMNDSFSSVYSNSALKHQAQKVYLEINSSNKDETIDKLNEIKYHSNVNIDILDWIYIKALYFYEDYEAIQFQATNLVDKVKATFIMGILTLCLNNVECYNKYISLKDQTEYLPHLRMYNDLNNIISILYNNRDYYTAYNDTKNLLRDERYFVGDEFIKNIIRNFFVELAVKNGKYRDAVKLLLEKNKTH